MNNPFEHIYTAVINLPKDLERRAFMESELQKLSIPYSLIEGVDGRTYDFTGIYDEERAVKYHGVPLTPPEKGCALSHRNALEEFLASGKPYGLILEDDVVLDSDFPKAIAYALSKKESWTYVQFNYVPVGIQGVHFWWFLLAHNTYLTKTGLFFAGFKGIAANTLSLLWGVRDAWHRTFGTSALARLVRDQYLAGCYLLTQDAARALIELNTPLTYTADRLQNIARRKGLIKERIYIPRTVRQKRESFPSSINNDHFGKEIISV